MRKDDIDMIIGFVLAAIFFGSIWAEFASVRDMGKDKEKNKDDK